MNDSVSSVVYSYAAGSASLDPYGYRRIQRGGTSRLSQLVSVFPTLRRWIHSQSLVISAYPASLGLEGTAPLVDTYLHPPTFVRACRLADRERRSVVFASQPLAGADLLRRLSRCDDSLPRQILWAVGGYPLPRSLESFLRTTLGARDCELAVLHAYGVAEIGHTCFAAIDRYFDGSPRYRQVPEDVVVESVGPEHRLKLTNHHGRSLLTDDHIEWLDNHWRLTNGRQRLAPELWRQLENWNDATWERRTGYLHARGATTHFQLRSSNVTPQDSNEIEHFEFWRRFGGSWTCKPAWKSAEKCHAADRES